MLWKTATTLNCLRCIICRQMCYNSDCYDFNIMAALCCWDANFPKCYQKLCQSSQRAIRRTDNYTSYTPLGPEKKSTFSIIILKSLSYDGSNGGYALYPKLVTLRHSDGATHRRLLHTFTLRCCPKWCLSVSTFIIHAHHACVLKSMPSNTIWSLPSYIPSEMNDWWKL